MSNIANLQRQHKEIAGVIGEIQNLMQNKKNIAGNSRQLALSIGTLAGKLKNHLLLEDKFLYPSLLNHKDQEIQKISKLFMAEMGNLNEVFSAYKTKYMIAHNIETDPEGFYKDSAELFQAINRRVIAEESRLYPLV